MAYCCSQCSFTAQFESALTMHHQLHHEDADTYPDTLPKIKEKAKTIPRESQPLSFFYARTQNKGIKLPGRTSSATKLFDKLRARICRSKTLFAHPEESADQSLDIIDISARSECTSKARIDSARTKDLDFSLETQREVYSCHICNFDADRITVLDRHLLNDHKIGLENLLKLVLAKTKDGLADEVPPLLFGIRQPYYSPLEDVTTDGEFIETVSTKIKILKHAATNTDLQWTDIPDLRDNCRMITNELNKLMKYPTRIAKDDLLAKMQTLNEYMCKFVDSTNTLKRVLSKEYVGRSRKGNANEKPYLELCLGDLNSHRDWERAHSEQLERHRGEKSKLTAESFYF